MKGKLVRRKMNVDERIADTYLRSLGFADVVFEPDGNIPPDFLIDGRVAVEVRRLNQNEESPEGPRGLEEVEIPLRDRVRHLLKTFGPARNGETWYVFYEFHRPIADDLIPRMQNILAGFRDANDRQPGSRPISERCELDLLRAGHPYVDFFVLGGYADLDAGGFVLSELDRNIRICVAEKNRKVARVRARYPEWWLLLVDHIGLGLDGEDRQQLRGLLQLDNGWDRILIASPLEPGRGYDL